MKPGFPLPAVCLICLMWAACGAPDTQSSQPVSGDSFQWPNGERAAVCLTYDDGIDGHVDIVAPDLEVENFRGTFYVPGSSESLARRMEEWRALARRGHELGNHTLFHPCIRNRPDGRVFEWVSPEYALENYTLQQIIAELYVMNTLLEAVDGKHERTYAYTCSDYEAGGESFVDSLRHLFTAARGDGEIPLDMRDVDIHLVPSWSAKEVSGQQMIDYVNRAAEHGTMAVFMFHGVGGGHNLNVSREAHRELLAYLSANRDRFWTERFDKVMAHVRSERKRLGWDR